MKQRTKEEQHRQDKQFLVECLTTDLAKILIEDYGYTLEAALDTLYKSRTYEKIERESTGLYFQSSIYVMDYLKEELSL
ncbi:MAG: hypothetical protein Q4E60_01120 [Bacteroidales bacterium]|nr:hypothetical protein [Bacteroidales bacterium]